MEDAFSRPVAAGVPAQPLAGEPTSRTIWWWVAAGGLVVAGAGALYLFSKKGKKARKGLAKKMKQVKGGLLVAALAGFANKAGQTAAGKVL